MGKIFTNDPPFYQQLRAIAIPVAVQNLITVGAVSYTHLMDLFPDYGRQIPFGTGTSILYNYLDYRFQNNTDRTYQLTVWTDEEYLHGELLADRPQQYSRLLYTSRCV